MTESTQAKPDSLRALLVLGQQHARRVFQHLLVNRGHEVESVTADEDIPSLMQRGPYDLAVVESAGDERDPVEVLRTLRGVTGTRDALILVLTSTDDIQHQRMLVNAGADELMRMPLALDEIELRLDAALRLAHRLRRPASEPASSSPGTENVLTLLPVAAFLLSERGDFVAVNREFADLVGYEVVDLIGRSSEYVGLPGSDYFPSPIDDTSAAEDRPRHDRLSLVRSDMTAVPVKLTWRPVELDGRVRIVGVVHRAQEHRKPDPLCTDARPASDDLSRGLSLVLDVQGRIRTISDEFAALFDEAADEIVGKDIRELVHEDDLKDVAAALRAGTTSIAPTGHRVARFRLTEADWAALAISGRDISDPHGSRGFLLVAREAEVPQHDAPPRLDVVAGETEQQDRGPRPDSAQHLRRALEKDQMQVVYQPEVDLHTGRIVGVETFVRWDQKRDRRLPAAEFIDDFVAEGLAHDLDRQVLRHAGQDASAWLQLPALEPRFRIGVSISKGTVTDGGGAIDLVRSAARRVGIPHSRLRVSLPMSLIQSDADALARTLQAFRRIGIQTALTMHDIAHIDQIPERVLTSLNVLKVPSELLDDVDGELWSELRRRTVAVVATAVETADDYQRALNGGIRVGQGYYFSHPVPEETFRFLATAGPRPFAGLVAAPAGSVDDQDSLTDAS